MTTMTGQPPEQAGTTVLAIERLIVRYGAIEALHGVSLTVQQGQIVTLIGANGAGKSSLLRSISGLVPAASGTICYDGHCDDQSEIKNGGGQKSKILCHRTAAHRIVEL